MTKLQKETIDLFAQVVSELGSVNFSFLVGYLKANGVIEPNDLKEALKTIKERKGN